jgi:hypothetical protein
MINLISTCNILIKRIIEVKMVVIPEVYLSKISVNKKNIFKTEFFFC